MFYIIEVPKILRKKSVFTEIQKKLLSVKYDTKSLKIKQNG